MTQGTGYLSLDGIFYFIPSFPGPFSCFQDFTTSEKTLSEMTQNYILQDVTTAGNDD